MTKWVETFVKAPTSVIAPYTDYILFNWWCTTDVFRC